MESRKANARRPSLLETACWTLGVFSVAFYAASLGYAEAERLDGIASLQLQGAAAPHERVDPALAGVTIRDVARPQVAVDEIELPKTSSPFLPLGGLLGLAGGAFLSVRRRFADGPRENRVSVL